MESEFVREVLEATSRALLLEAQQQEQQLCVLLPCLPERERYVQRALDERETVLVEQQEE